MTAKDLKATSTLDGLDQKLFTEEQLPRGTMILIGRNADGAEVSTKLDILNPSSWSGTVKLFADYLSKPQSKTP